MWKRWRGDRIYTSMCVCVCVFLDMSHPSPSHKRLEWKKKKLLLAAHVLECNELLLFFLLRKKFNNYSHLKSEVRTIRSLLQLCHKLGVFPLQTLPGLSHQIYQLVEHPVPTQEVFEQSLCSCFSFFLFSLSLSLFIQGSGKVNAVLQLRYI